MYIHGVVSIKALEFLSNQRDTIDDCEEVALSYVEEIHLLMLPTGSVFFLAAKLELASHVYIFSFPDGFTCFALWNWKTSSGREDASPRPLEWKVQINENGYKRFCSSKIAPHHAFRHGQESTGITALLDANVEAGIPGVEFDVRERDNLPSIWVEYKGEDLAWYIHLKSQIQQPIAYPMVSTDERERSKARQLTKMYVLQLGTEMDI